MTPLSQFLFEKSYPRKLARINAGAAISAVAQKAKAIARYNAKPNRCKNCSSIVALKDGRPIQESRRRKFCSSSCSAKFNNFGVGRNGPKLARINCGQCSLEFQPKYSKTRFCSRRCSSLKTSSMVSPEEMLRRGFGDSARSKKLRLGQLVLEEGMAESMRADGWEIFSPTVVCDRVGVKDGKVFFIEFKPVKNQKLRPGQRRICDLVPEMYKIIVK